MALKYSEQYDSATTTRSGLGTGISTGRFTQTDSPGGYADVSCMMGTAGGNVGASDFLVLGRCPDKAFVLGIFTNKSAVGTIGYIDELTDTAAIKDDTKIGFLNADSEPNAMGHGGKFIVYKPATGGTLVKGDRVVVLLAQ